MKNDIFFRTINGIGLAAHMAAQALPDGSPQRVICKMVSGGCHAGSYILHVRSFQALYRNVVAAEVRDRDKEIKLANNTIVRAAVFVAGMADILGLHRTPQDQFVNDFLSASVQLTNLYVGLDPQGLLKNKPQEPQV